MNHTFTVSFIFFTFGIICSKHYSVHVPLQKTSKSFPIYNAVTDRQHYLIEFVTPPHDEKQHADWIAGIEKALERTGQTLVEKGLLIPPHRYSEKKPTTSTFIEKVKQVGQDLFYDVFFRTHSLVYPQKINYPFFTRNNSEFGSMGVYAPDGVPPLLFVEVLKHELQRQAVEATIIKDYPFYTDVFPVETFAYAAFDYEALEALKSGELQKQYIQRLDYLEKKYKDALVPHKEKKEIALLQETVLMLDAFEGQLFWHQTIPTTGIRLEPTLWDNDYPFIPHQFPLWVMAPKLGAGVKVAIIDTGIAAFDLQSTGPEIPHLCKNADLSVTHNYMKHNYNLIADHNLSPTDTLVDTLLPYLDKKTFTHDFIKQTELETFLCELLHTFHSDTQLFKEQLTQYLLKHATETLVKKGRKELLPSADTLIAQLEQKMKKFHKVGITDQKTRHVTDAFLEFMPTAPIVKNNKKTFQSGHGSHVAGIIAGRLNQKSIEETAFQPLEDKGICGIAPNAEIIMIKAFNDDGISRHSTLIASLIQAIKHEAHIVNMSLKAADKLNKKGDFSLTFHTLINLIPYCVASSGNNGDPSKKSFAGNVEAYPAGIDGVAFSVGAFAFNLPHHTCPIARFSQFQETQNGDSGGPFFVAPGFNIISSGLSDKQYEGSTAVVMQGTSMAAPMLSGFLALMLSEFPDNVDFNRDQLLTVCYSCGIKMMDNKDWKQKSIFGSLDMRTALFILHVLRHYKHQEGIKGIIPHDLFNKLLAQLHQYLFYEVNRIGKKELGGVEFKKNFCTFYQQFQQQKQKPTNAITAEIKQEKNIKAQFEKAIETVSTHLQSIDFKELPTADFFKDLHGAAHNKLNAVFSHERTKEFEKSEKVVRYLGRAEREKLNQWAAPYTSYWHNQATLL